MSDVVALQRWVKYAAEAYTDPSQFKTPEEYLQALTEVLDEVAALAGKEPPNLEGVWS